MSAHLLRKNFSMDFSSIRSGSLISHMANEFGVRNVLHGQVSLTTVNHSCVIFMRL